ncbi:lysozyme inhibitor LprI family protein [Kluyvera georgiana]|uniref:lysozyme inhibitor LprI family protein n=2 Tax=Kluyvera georgiana TaxID=73098 RepID=UPI0023037602|nr:lysozyme inhibitor LprI family protein [Kluyvera georgiana]MDA8492908.1 DUF1311 domain-containing protein [Kluyvera georgiana]
MIRKALALVVLSASFSSYAGLFDSAPELKCGNDNSIAAFKEWVYNDALSQLQDRYIKTPDIFFKIPLADYEKQLQAIPIQLENVLTETQQSDNNTANCVAKVSFGIPTNTLELLKALPNNLEYINRGNSQMLNNKIIWKKISYKIQFADNNKDIIVSGWNSTGALSDSMYNMAALAVKKDRLIEKQNQLDVSYSEGKYKQNDIELNRIWAALPDSIRSGMKKEQQAWVASKVTQCGKLSDAQSKTLPTESRIRIYECQNKMTLSRIEQLGGDGYGMSD